MSPWYKTFLQRVSQKYKKKLAYGDRKWHAATVMGTLLAAEKMAEIFLSVQVDRVSVIVNTIVINEPMLE